MSEPGKPDKNAVLFIRSDKSGEQNSDVDIIHLLKCHKLHKLSTVAFVDYKFISTLTPIFLKYSVHIPGRVLTRFYVI